MVVTKEVLLADIEQKKAQIIALSGTIEYAQSLIKYIEKEDKKEDKKA